MICVTVVYPTGPDSRFNRAYYLEKHIPLANSRFEPLGMKKAELLDGKPGLDGSNPAYHMMANLYFTSADALQNALAKHGAEVMADIPNYTNVQAIIYVGEVL
jgi:uncharacterized protein (TIGR02118 family)